MVSIVLSLHAVIVCTLFMLLIHMHLTKVRDLTVTNTVGFATGALLWPAAAAVLIYIYCVHVPAKERRLTRGLSDGRWRQFLGRENTDYGIDGDAFERFEQEEARRQDRRRVAARQRAHAHAH